MKRYLALFTVLAVFTTLSFPAAAQKAKAKKAFDKGVVSMEDHDYKKALQSFETAYKAAPHWMVLAHIGNCHAKLNNPVKSIAAYEQFIKDGGDDIDPDERNAARKNIREQRKKVGTLFLLVKPKSSRVNIDGESIGNPPFEEILLKAGPHHILVIREEEEEEKDISIYSGKELTVRMYPKDDSMAAVVTPKPKPKPKPQPQPQPEPEPEPEPIEAVLMVSTNVDPAMVILDSEERGETPFEEDLMAGAYNLEVGAEGYMPYADNITITGGMVNTFNVSLVGEDEKPNPLSTPFFVAVGIAGAGLIMGGIGWGVYGTNKSSADNYGSELDNLENPDDGDPFNWNVDCPDGVVLTPGTAHDYYCRNEWERREYESKAKTGLGLGIAGTSIFVVGGAMAALFYFKPELFFGAESDAQIILTPIATGDQTALMLSGRF